MENKDKKILVLGSSGMLGRAVHTYLHAIFPLTTFGSQKRPQSKNQQIFVFDANNYKENFAKTYKRVKSVDFVINCIGKFEGFDSIQDLIFINSIFPHKLEELSNEYNFKLFHVSSDAIFSNKSKIMYENDNVSPEGIYGASKLLGETTSKNALTFRISIIGFDPHKRKGIFEWALQNKDNTINGFTNQQWSGCTTLQFAQLCEDIIKNNRFSTLRNVSYLFHFAPLGPVSKYTLLKEFLRLMKSRNTVRKAKGEKRSRILKTRFFDYLKLSKYTHDIRPALQELIEFEEKIVNYP